MLGARLSLLVLLATAGTAPREKPSCGDDRRRDIERGNQDLAGWTLALGTDLEVFGTLVGRHVSVSGSSGRQGVACPASCVALGRAVVTSFAAPR